MELTRDYAKAVVTSDRTARLVVWGIWLAMLAVAFAFMYKVSHPIPLAEDWLMVAPLTGKEPNVAGWLWAQVNEHRIPVPRLIMLLLLEATHGDFRSGGFFNVVLLGLLAALSIVAVRRLQGGVVFIQEYFFFQVFELRSYRLFVVVIKAQAFLAHLQAQRDREPEPLRLVEDLPRLLGVPHPDRVAPAFLEYVIMRVTSRPFDKVRLAVTQQLVAVAAAHNLYFSS